MQIVLVLAVVAAAVLLALGGTLIASLVFGGVLAATKRGRIIAPILCCIVPAMTTGGIVGAALVGYFAIRADDNLVVVGPMGGLVAGVVLGFLIGSAVAVLWWWHMSAKKQRGITQP